MSTLPKISFPQKFQDGRRIPEVVITLRQKMIPRWSQRLWQCFSCLIHLHQHRHCPTRHNTIRCKPEVETVTKTGSTNNLATETDIDAISVAIPMFWGKVFTGVYVNFARHFLPSKIPRWPTYTGNSYNFATENEMIPRWSQRCGNVSGHARSTSTSIDIVQLETTLSGANRK